jgi:hypothetical protein
MLIYHELAPIEMAAIRREFRPHLASLDPTCAPPVFSSFRALDNVKQTGIAPARGHLTNCS